jgi:hypothetical protein
MGAHDPALFDAPATLSERPASFEAVVESVDGDRLHLRDLGSGQRFEARLAYSCLVQPAARDRVACWRGSDVTHVLAVLSRPDEQATRQLQLGERCEVHAGKLDIHAADASFCYRSLLAVGELCRHTVGQLRLAGATLSTVFDRQVHHARQHQRTVDGLDRVQAQIIEQHADELMHLQARHVLATGEQLVKVCGAQIHFG